MRGLVVVIALAGCGHRHDAGDVVRDGAADGIGDVGAGPDSGDASDGGSSDGGGDGPGNADSSGSPDAAIDAAVDAAIDAGIDAAEIPPPPVLGAQISRMGRPAIRDLLIGTFAPDTTAAAMRDAYNRAPDPATWKATVLEGTVTVEAELKANLAVLDAIDKGLVVARELTGCGNAVLYAPLPGPASYQGAAEIFADDQLYIDTSKPTCEVYLSLEIEKASNATFPHRECGGRTPSHDAIDTTYSVLAGGTDALDPATLNGQISDGAAAHHDVQDTFPFLGAPH